MLDQAESLRRLVSREVEPVEKEKPVHKAKIITVTSGKGGVGKSNFVVNLGIALQKQGKKVLIFDADIGMGNDDVLMGVYPKYTIFDVLKGKDIKDIVVEGAYGIKLLAGGSGINQVEDLQPHERTLFLNKIESLTEFDYILMDTGAGINRSVLAFIACSDELVIITTPEPTSITDAYSLVKATDHFKLKEKAHLVVNKSFTKQEGEQTYAKFKRAVNRFLKVEMNYLGCILDDKKLVMGVREQTPFVVSYPNSEASKSIEEIAGKFLGNYDTRKATGATGMFKKLFKIFS